MDEAIRARLGLPPAAPDRARKDLRVFGLILGAILVLLGLRAWHHGRAVAPYELALGLLAALLAGLKPEALKPVHGPWMKAAKLVGKVNTTLVMALVYYLVLTPYAALARWLGGDLLDEKMGDRPSYWHNRQGLPERESYRNQF